MFTIAKIRSYIGGHERWFTYGALGGGFLFDAIFFQRVDLLFENAVIIAHLIVGIIAIALLHIRRSWFIERPFLERVRVFLPLVMQFAIGGLFGKFVIFYSRSGTLIKSWPFLFTMIALFVGNERFRGRYEKLNFRLAIFFAALFTYCSYATPIITHEIGLRSFLLGGGVSLLLMFTIVRALHHFIEPIVWRERLILFGTMLSMSAFFMLLYFTNSIPPLPLALKDIGVFHSVRRSENGSYLLTAEASDWNNFFMLYPSVHLPPGGTLYVYSAIFSPTELNTKVNHVWSHYDEASGAWRAFSTVQLPVVGGRGNGYRTYSSSAGLSAGYYRVDVTTREGQIIGRLTFKAVITAATPALFLEMRS